MQTNTEYMSNPARVERVVQGLMCMTLGQMSNARTDAFIEFAAAELIEKEHLSAERMQDMPYIEFACLIDSIGGNPKYDYPDHDSAREQLALYKMAASILMEMGKSSIPVRLFLALPLKAFYTYMDSASAQGGMMDEFEAVRNYDSHYKEGCTINDFLSEKMGAARKSWIPITSMEDYKQSIVNAYKGMGSLLVDSFRRAFPNRFHAEEVCRRYRQQIAEPVSHEAEQEISPDMGG